MDVILLMTMDLFTFWSFIIGWKWRFLENFDKEVVAWKLRLEDSMLYDQHDEQVEISYKVEDTLFDGMRQSLSINLSKSSKVRGNMSRIKSWDEIVDKMVDRLSKWKMKTLSIGGRLTLLKAVLGSMPIYYMSIFKALMLYMGYGGLQLKRNLLWTRVIKVFMAKMEKMVADSKFGYKSLAKDSPGGGKHEDKNHGDKYEYEERREEKLEEVKVKRRSRSPRRNPSVFTRLRRERSRSPQHEYKNKERRESTVFKRLESRGRSTSVHSDSRQESSRYTENYYKSEDSEGGHWKSKLQRKKSSVEDDDLSQPWVCAETDPFTSRIRYFDFPKTRIPSHVKTYNGSEDPEDH
ncbi:hypothetical protein Tco_0598968 [Tanacetum coccineum]